MEYAESGALQAEPLHEDSKIVLRKLFKSKDIDSSGHLDPDELEECLFAIGLCPTKDDIHFFIKSFDKNGDGKLQIEELVDNAHILHAHSLHGEDLMSAFKVFDIDGDGFIRHGELLKILCHNDFMPVQEARHILTNIASQFDRDKDGKYNYAEFVEIFLSEDFQNKVVHRSSKEPVLCKANVKKK